MQVTDYIIFALMLATLAALVLGLANMLGGKDPARGNRLMTWRVGLQAVVILLAALFLLGK